MDAASSTTEKRLGKNFGFLPLCFLLTVALSACVTSVSKDDWPTNLPERRLFSEAWEQQFAAGSVSSDLNSHLVWILRFYQGSVLYPIGWNDMTESVLESLEPGPRRDEMQQRLYDLGLAISVEWAQDNGKRLIDSNAVAVWGNALRTAVEQGEQFEFVSKIEIDVEALLKKQLQLSEIERERYYPPQDYDNF